MQPGPAKPVALRKELALALLIKVLVLAVIWQLWFSAPQDQSLDDRQVAAKMLAKPIPEEPDHDAVPRAR